MATDEELDALADAELNKDKSEEQQLEVAEDHHEQEETVKPVEEKKESSGELERLKLENQRLKSELGRIPNLQSKVDSLEAIVKQRLANEDVDQEEKIVATKDDVISILREQKMIEAEEVNKYSEAARNAMLDMAEDIEDDDVFVNIYKDAEKNWTHRSNNPQLDARINFREAELRYYKTLATAKRNPLEKNKDKETKNLGGPAETVVTAKDTKVPELDEYANDFAKRSGMKPESIAKALKGDIPNYLRGSKF